MGKKIQCIGRYKMDGIVLGKGNFAYVELATHGVTKVKVSHVVSLLRAHTSLFSLSLCNRNL